MLKLSLCFVVWLSSFLLSTPARGAAENWFRETWSRFNANQRHTCLDSALADRDSPSDLLLDELLDAAISKNPFASQARQAMKNAGLFMPEARPFLAVLHSSAQEGALGELIRGRVPHLDSKIPLVLAFRDMGTNVEALRLFTQAGLLSNCSEAEANYRMARLSLITEDKQVRALKINPSPDELKRLTGDLVPELRGEFRRKAIRLLETTPEGFYPSLGFLPFFNNDFQVEALSLLIQASKQDLWRYLPAVIAFQSEEAVQGLQIFLSEEGSVNRSIFFISLITKKSQIGVLEIGARQNLPSLLPSLLPML